MLVRLAVVAAVASLVAATAGEAEPLATRSWTSAPPLLAARGAHAVVVADGSIVALDGTGANGAPVQSVERFDGRRLRVETELPVPGGLNATAAAAIGSRIYVIGGFEGTGNTPTAQVRVYDLDTRTWSNAAPLPSPRGGHAAVVLGDRIHVLGGGNSVSTLADHSVYDPSTNRWAGAAPLRRGRGALRPSR